MEVFSSTFLLPLSQTPKISSSLVTSSLPNISLGHNSLGTEIEDRHQSTTSTPSKSTSDQILKKTHPSPYTTQKKHSPVVPRPTNASSFPTNFFNAIDDFINTSIDPPSRPSVNPKYVLSYNFGPVDELPPTECEVVEGSLPLCLNGAYIRNGPNPQFLPRGPFHLFDGDGMLHSIRISNGNATFCSRFVKTYKYITERNTGSPVIPNFFSGFRGLRAFAARAALAVARIVTGQFNIANGFGAANTSLAFFGGHLYALAESDLPYSVNLAQNGDIVTIGRHDFDGKLVERMTAHPKVDPETGEAFAFRYGILPPFLTFFRINAFGIKEPDVPIFSMLRPTLLHDFAITKKYAVFPDIQIGVNPLNIITGGSPIGSDPRKTPRLGVIPRYANDESEMKWFEVPGLNFLHVINAWDEDDGDTIVVVAPNILPVEHIIERMDLVHASIEKIRIDLKSGMVRRQQISTKNLELAVINPAYVGKKNRYVLVLILVCAQDKDNKHFTYF